MVYHDMWINLKETFQEPISCSFKYLPANRPCDQCIHFCATTSLQRMKPWGLSQLLSLYRTVRRSKLVGTGQRSKLVTLWDLDGPYKSQYMANRWYSTKEHVFFFLTLLECIYIYICIYIYVYLVLHG